MQPTTLGRYLLYRPDQLVPRRADGGSAKPAADPSPAADWTVKPGGPGALHARAAVGARPDAARRRLACARLRHRVAADVRARDRLRELPRGRARRDRQAVRGTTCLRQGRRPGRGPHALDDLRVPRRALPLRQAVGPYGIRYALPDCSSIEGPQGTAAPFQNTLNYGNPAQPHDTRGYPQLTAWSPNNLTYEGTYWRWIQRSWMAGLRLMVMGINENRILCELQSNRKTNCNEMDTVRRGLKDVHELQDYVDAQAGGPGKGFFQIVTNPYEARRVINQGKMAVVLEIEVSEPFDCAGWDSPTCTQAQVDAQFDEMQRDGVRSMLLLNKFDNPLTGVRFDEGPIGVRHQQRQQGERRPLLEREDLHRAAARQHDLPARRRRPPRARGAARHARAPAAARRPPIRRRRTATRAA